jgi:hypothetical protein
MVVFFIGYVADKICTMFLLPKQPADRREPPGKPPVTTGVHGLHFEKHCPVVSHNEKIRYEIHMRIVQICFVCIS